jgi:predicted adenylyl cyclase CyaB
LRNIELKARLADLQAARNVARTIATKRLGVQQQADTYFHCRHGRLKLRQIDGLSAQLIWYARPDQQGPKASQYQLVPISNAETLKAALAAALGVRVVVQKRREIFLVDNVRIHLDEVAGLGDFLEFEAVLGPETDAILGPETADAAGRAQLDQLIETFALDPGDLLSGSYGDMLG